MLKNKEGSSILTTPIIIAIGIIFVSLLILMTVEILMPYLWYEKLSSSCIKYIYVMEEYGYLTNKEANVLLNDLEAQGFERKNISLKYTNNKTKYGEPIYLKLMYKYEMNFPLAKARIIDMEIERNSVSKR